MNWVLLTEGFYRLELDKQTQFSVYAASGGLQPRAVVYLLRSGEGQMPPELTGPLDLGLPGPEGFRIFDHGRGWKHVAVWDDSEGAVLEKMREAIIA